MTDWPDFPSFMSPLLFALCLILVIVNFQLGSTIFRLWFARHRTIVMSALAKNYGSRGFMGWKMAQLEGSKHPRNFSVTVIDRIKFCLDRSKIQKDGSVMIYRSHGPMAVAGAA